MNSALSDSLLTMKWEKQGVIYNSNGINSWAEHSALQPTPILLDNQVIRVFCGFRDKQGVSRIGYVDVDANEPSKVLSVSEKPALDVGKPGTFDENGVVPCAIVQREGRLFLYYAGYQLGQKIRFCVFGGLAVSDDNGQTFQRYKRVPVLDRTDHDLYFRVAHTVMYDNGIWRVWYGGGDSFDQGQDKTLPRYNIRYTESQDGIHFSEEPGKVVLDMRDDEYRVGRPYVIRNGIQYLMFFCAGSENTGYRLAYAESPDGLYWNRQDEALGLNVSDSGWDSEMMAYPSVIKYQDKTYLLYNGNNYGKAGFGYAILQEKG